MITEDMQINSDLTVSLRFNEKAVENIKAHLKT